MRYTVLLRERQDGFYTATAPAVPECRGEGKTRSEAVADLKLMLEEWLSETEITTIEVSGKTALAENVASNPWIETAGAFADDPTLESMLREIYAERIAEGQAE